MKIIDRMFLAIYSFFIAIASFVLILAPINRQGYIWLNDLMRNYMSSQTNIVIVIFFFIMSIRVLFSGMKGKKVKHNSVIKNTSYGEVKISMKAIEGMAQKSANRIYGLKEIEAIANQVEEGLLIDIKALTLTDINIPEIAVKIQKNIKNDIELSTGVSVKAVSVCVNDIAMEIKKRVE